MGISEAISLMDTEPCRKRQAMLNRTSATTLLQVLLHGNVGSSKLNGHRALQEKANHAKPNFSYHSMASFCCLMNFSCTYAQF